MFLKKTVFLPQKPDHCPNNVIRLDRYDKNVSSNFIFKYGCTSLVTGIIRRSAVMTTLFHALLYVSVEANKTFPRFFEEGFEFLPDHPQRKHEPPTTIFSSNLHCFRCKLALYTSVHHPGKSTKEMSLQKLSRDLVQLRFFPAVN